MSKITLEAVKAKQAELAAMIDTLIAASVTLFLVPEARIELRDGERYAGAVLDDNGNIKHHLVLMAEQPDDTMMWKAAMDWAQSVGGSLPTRQEQALLYANCKPHLKASWHWSSETYEGNSGYAWCCYFNNGGQNYVHKDYRGSVRAVRRVNP